MQINFEEARKLCTAAELSLLQDSRPKIMTGFSGKQLKQKAATARKYSDKWREQSMRGGNSSDGSAARSKQKHGLFREALSRFEARIARLEKPAVKTPTKKVATKTTKKAAKKAVKKIVKKSARASIKGNSDAAMPLSKRANQKAVTTSRRIAASGLTSRIRGHVSASGRRNQAARSSRKRS